MIDGKQGKTFRVIVSQNDDSELAKKESQKKSMQLLKKVWCMNSVARSGHSRARGSCDL